jgi:hypothetical protein
MEDTHVEPQPVAVDHTHANCTHGSEARRVSKGAPVQALCWRKGKGKPVDASTCKKCNNWREAK